MNTIKESHVEECEGGCFHHERKCCCFNLATLSDVSTPAEFLRQFGDMCFYCQGKCQLPDISKNPCDLCKIECLPKSDGVHWVLGNYCRVYCNTKFEEGSNFLNFH